MVRDLVQIRSLGESKQAENIDFRRYIKAHHHRPEEFQAVAAEIEQQFNCTECANCCRYSLVTVNSSEIARIAEYLGCDPDEVVRLYTVPDPEAQTTRLLASNPGGCIFLDENLCTIYDARPEACRDFPHVSLGNHTLGGRMSSISRWASLCPIVYNALEEYKHVVGYDRRPHHAIH